MPTICPHEIFTDKIKDEEFAKDIAASQTGGTSTAVEKGQVLPASSLQTRYSSGLVYFVDESTPLRTSSQVMQKFGVSPETLKLRGINVFDSRGNQQILFPAYSETQPLNLITRRVLHDSQVQLNGPVLPFQMHRQFHYLKKNDPCRPRSNLLKCVA